MTFKRKSTKARNDEGMTLPELLISVTLTGLLITSLSMVSTVLLHSMDNNQGRANNARSEQNVGVWMPTDLASAEGVDTTAPATPCGPGAPVVPAKFGPTPACPAGLDLGGSNTLLLVWHGSVLDALNNPVDTTTMVSYRYEFTGSEYVLNRVLCTWSTGGPATCSLVAVLHGLDGPPTGITFTPGTDSPTWVIKVTSALAAADTSGVAAVVTDPGFTTKNARRVLVTINGGGDVAGAGGGTNTFSFSAGGTDRKTSLSTNDLSGAPTFTAARTRCGGNYGLIVDNSGSIGSDFVNVKNGILNFIDTFSGKPVKLQIVAFSTVSQTVGASADPWTRYFDMLVPADVTALKTAVGGLSSAGYTNWEDSWFRMLSNSDGTVRTVLPDKVIFFTDGLPNMSRLENHTGTAAPVVDPSDDGLSAPSGAAFYQTGWNRTARIINETGVTDVVGVFVGDDTSAVSQWETSGAGYVYQYWRNNNIHYQHSFHYQRNFHYQTKVGSTWSDVSLATYNAESSGSRKRIIRPDNFNNDAFDYWDNVTLATYNTSLASQRRIQSEPPNGVNDQGWTDVAQSAYDAGGANSTADASDGWQTVVVGGLSSNWTSVTSAQYAASNTTTGGTDANDGWKRTKIYPASGPYDGHENSATVTKSNKNILADLVAPGGATYAVYNAATQSYGDVREVNMFAETNWARFDDAIRDVALGECGGTVTIQTKVGSGAGASSVSDPFTYTNLAHQKVETSAAYKSGTFDVVLPGAAPATLQINVQNQSTLTSWQYVSWACTEKGVALTAPTMQLLAPDANGWRGLTLNVAANTAISCIQTVAPK